MKYAILEGDVVVNIAASDRALGAGWAAIPTGVPVQIGDRCVSGVFYAPSGAPRLAPETAIVAAQLDAYETAYQEGVQSA